VLRGFQRALALILPIRLGSLASTIASLWFGTGMLFYG